VKIMKNRPIGFKSLNAFGLSVVLATATFFGAIEASAHGYVSNPKSRAFLCTSAQGGGSSAACIAAAAAGNSRQYEPQSIGIGGANDNHQQLIPDGKLCSANIGSMNGLNLARGDWGATSVSAGSRTFVWTNTAQHKTTYFRYYITKQGFNPATTALKWSDLEQIHQTGPSDREATSTHTINLPQRTGRHIVYSIWQRDPVADAPEAFYQCIDVVYGGTPTSSAPASSVGGTSSSRAATSSVSNNTCAGLAAWNSSTVYTKPQQVQRNGKRYQANYWTQGNDPVLSSSGLYDYWLDLGACSEGGASSVATSTGVASSSRAASSVSTGSCTSPAYVNGASYANGAKVVNGGKEYQCKVGGWCSQGGAYAPGTGWAWGEAWTLLRSCN
jgi:chitin-binding protein